MREETYKETSISIESSYKIIKALMTAMVMCFGKKDGIHYDVKEAKTAVDSIFEDL